MILNKASSLYTILTYSLTFFRLCLVIIRHIIHVQQGELLPALHVVSHVR